MKAAHIITLVLWAFGIVNIFEPFNGWVYYVGLGVFYILFVAHLIECVVYRDKILKSQDSPFVAFSMTLIFGVIYLGSIKES
jgi:uncharacterized protein YhhL (DUF1145 family)|tara:strand:+ start:173 stop:418 length:246 start_codon:yes stop_codon:yes gene_type:complete